MKKTWESYLLLSSSRSFIPGQYQLHFLNPSFKNWAGSFWKLTMPAKKMKNACVRFTNFYPLLLSIQMWFKCGQWGRGKYATARNSSGGGRGESKAQPQGKPVCPAAHWQSWPTGENLSLVGVMMTSLVWQTNIKHKCHCASPGISECVMGVFLRRGSLFEIELLWGSKSRGQLEVREPGDTLPQEMGENC